MAKEVVIDIKNVKKGFKSYSDKGHTLKERLLFFKSRNSYTKHEVLKNISLEIYKGDVIGLVGKNGCGKSTLLKLITKIIYPDTGSIKVNGRVSSLLELGAGFHPDMTGRENIYINASIFGLTKKEIERKMSKIISFSELEEFMDSPVRTYSSGMYMRLAFSVAINVEADILLIDEILAVGDANFQNKCFNKMQELKNNGTTIVIVSHELGSIEKLCNKAVWIEEGIIREIGDPLDITSKYFDKIMNKENKFEQKIKDIEIVNVKIMDELNDEKEVFDTEESMIIEVEYKKNNKEVDSSIIGFGIFRNDGIKCYETSKFHDEVEKIKLNESGKVKIKINLLKLLPGEYYIDIFVQNELGLYYDFIKKVKKIKVFSNLNDSGIFRINYEYKHLNGS